MNIKDIQDAWKNDSVIDKTDIPGELILISSLHSKYINFLTRCRRKQKALEITYNRLKKIKRAYYLGRLSRKAIEDLGWEPIDKEINPSDLPDYIKGDTELCEIEADIAMQEIMGEFLKDVLKSIHSRGYNLKALIDWEKFTNGIG